MLGSLVCVDEGEREQEVVDETVAEIVLLDVMLSVALSERGSNKVKLRE